MTFNEPQRLLLVGGAGRMGRIFAHAFSQLGIEVQILEQGEAYICENISTADMVMLAVPMERVCAVASTIGPYLRPDALLVDINSLKKDICAAMTAAHAGEVLGLHPMFGPSVSTLGGQKIVVCPVRAGEKAAWLQDVLRSWECELVESTPEQHDKMMALIQALVHFSKIVLGATLRTSGVSIEEALRFVSPIYLLELSVLGRIFAQDAGLYAEIEMENPWAPALRKQFMSQMQVLQAIVDVGDREGFARIFSEVREYFHEFSTQALELSDAAMRELLKTKNAVSKE